MDLTRLYKHAKIASTKAEEREKQYEKMNPPNGCIRFGQHKGKKFEDMLKPEYESWVRWFYDQPPEDLRGVALQDRNDLEKVIIAKATETGCDSKCTLLDRLNHIFAVKGDGEYVLQYGKYKGKKLLEVDEEDRGYFDTVILMATKSHPVDDLKFWYGKYGREVRMIGAFLTE